MVDADALIAAVRAAHKAQDTLRKMLDEVDARRDRVHEQYKAAGEESRQAVNALWDYINHSPDA